MEAKAVAQKLHLSLEQFVAEYCDPRWPGTHSFLLCHKSGACTFLTTSPGKKQKHCSIHTFKPACCLEWQSGLDKVECRQGLKNSWDLEIDSSGRIWGTCDKLKEFRNYLSL
jgi:hypothetical protein